MKRWGILAVAALLAIFGIVAGLGLDPAVLFPDGESLPVTSASALRQSPQPAAVSGANDERREAQVAINPASTGQPLPPAAIPQPLAETYGNWRVRCVLDLQSRETCRAEQVLRDDSGRPQLALAVHAGKADQAARLDIRPPWGISIEAGVILQVDGNGSLRAPLILCQPTGCEAVLNMPEPFLASLRNGTQLQMRVVSAEGQLLTTNVPLAGFAEAYGRLSHPR